MALVCKPFGDIITFSRTSGATWFNAAGNLVGVDFSVTSNTIGTGSKTFTLDATAGVNRSWATGDSVLISDQSNSANNMTGTVTSYTASTQVLVVNVTSTGGSGTIASWRVSSLMPRLDYNPSTLAAQGLLIEEARTNLCLQSADLFENGTGGVNWIWPAGVVTGNTQTAPDGTTTADTITTTGGAQSVYQSITVTASTSYTFSVFVKLGTMSVSDYKIAFYNNTAAAFIATDVVPTQVPNTSGWTRINYTFTTPVGCTSVRIYPFRNSAGITSSTVFIWGAQLEVGAFPTSYIPTTTTALTRSADAASVNTLAPWYNATEGTLYAEGVPIAPVTFTSNQVIASIDDGTTNNRFQIYRSANAGYFASITVVAGVPGYNPTIATVWSQFAVAKTAFSYASSGQILAAGGTLDAGTASPAAPTVTRLTLGARADSVLYFNGYLRRITYYPRRLANADLQAITA